MTEPAGWHYNEQINVYQRVSGKVFVYVSELMFGYKAQLYERGYRNMMLCLTEIRTKDQGREALENMFAIGEVWLYHYSDGDLQRISKDFYAIDNPEGVWGEESEEKKLYWI